MSVEPARAAKRTTRDRIGRLAEDGPASIDRASVHRGASIRVGALTVASLQQVRRRLTHLHEPEDQSENRDDAPKLADPRTRGWPVVRRYRTRIVVRKGLSSPGAL